MLNNIKNTIKDRMDFIRKNMRLDYWEWKGVEIAMYFTSEKDAHFVECMWHEISRSNRLTPEVQAFLRECYKQGLVEFYNEESKLHYCGVWDSDQLK